MTAAPSRRTRPPGSPARREGAARSSTSRSSTGRAQHALAHAVRLDPADDGLVELPAPKHLRVAPKVSRRVLNQRRRARWIVVGLAAISAASMFLLVTFHVFAVQSSFQLDKLEHQRSDAQRRNEHLRSLVASRSSATAIVRAATIDGLRRVVNPIPLNLAAPGTNAPRPSPTPIKMPTYPYGDSNASAAAP